MDLEQSGTVHTVTYTLADDLSRINDVFEDRVVHMGQSARHWSLLLRLPFTFARGLRKDRTAR